MIHFMRGQLTIDIKSKDMVLIPNVENILSRARKGKMNIGGRKRTEKKRGRESNRKRQGETEKMEKREKRGCAFRFKTVDFQFMSRQRN